MLQLSLMSRSSAELFDIVSLVSELLPKLPRDNIFSVNSLLIGQLSSSQSVQWCWKDEKGQWKPYKLPESRVIEVSHLNQIKLIIFVFLFNSYN